MVDIKEFVSHEKLRCDSFRFLAACFYQPQRDVFQEGLLQNLTESLTNVCPDAAVYAKEMIKLLPVYSDEELLVDYSKLFVGPTELAAAPYGSVYMENAGRIMGDSTMSVVDFYESHGLVMDDNFTEVPDHIAVELEFMYYLVFNEIQAFESSDMTAVATAMESQEVFLDKFLREWADKFADKMSEGAETGFYKALAGCLSAFIYKNNVKLPQVFQAAV